ncbi:arginine--tRNA ligase [Sutcliffiella cohnii]|uniref:Arginine--tRNA ligase n=1 Tax=Sutcliffiella cohnii TaxID=33932 RepID=A0A223KT64_9BACI|nr:arginine--tRNA ligase [Sutcliffiella cohnii]AST92692.1 arginine--tRNA ligase [Sutcliffiella cohnii]
MYKKLVAEQIYPHIQQYVTLDEVESLIEKPKYVDKGDIAFPSFTLAKHLKKAPNVIAKTLAEKLNHPLFEKIVADGPYVNFFLHKQEVSKTVLTTVLKEGKNYGKVPLSQGENITIDLSSPNIAKPFSMGHLRSTVIGNAIANISEKCGYTPIRINHLGDWGTQFGKLIVAYKKWGNEQAVKENPITELLKLYVQFHSEAEKDTSLEDEGRLWFKKLEDYDEEATHLWEWFRNESLKEFNKIYELLQIKFDSYNGEAFYNDKMEETIHLLQEKNLLESSDGAEVVSLEEYSLPPCLIKKSDGATLYATRDLTAALYRQQHYGFQKAVYVVGHEQSLHFQQIFNVLKKLGFHWANEMVHVPFGFILKDGKKMSTRKGKIVLLEEVINDAIELAAKSIEAKNPSLPEKEEVAKIVGVGAIIFHDLKNERMNNIEFSLEEMLKFEGSTGPYVQYTHARACSILRKGSSFKEAAALTGLQDEHSWNVVKLLIEFPSVIEKSFINYEPSQVAKYVIDLAREFNKYYSHVKVLTEDEQIASRLALVQAVTIVLEEGLRLLGIQAPKEM